jgi:hypothetical protein
LTNGSELTQYTHSLNGDAYGNALHASADGDWLFGLGGDDKLISDKESTRSSYYNYYTGKTWGDSASYDLCVNASRLGPEGTKEFIADFIRRRMKR